MNILVNNHNIYLILLITFVASAFLIPIAMKIAKHVGAMDEPNERRINKIPMPTQGGIAIYGAFLLGYILFGDQSIGMLSILIGSFLLIMMGIIDGIKPIKARYKLLVQIIAACIVVFYGQMFMSKITLLGLNFVLTNPWNYIVSIVFIVAITNAINLIDGLDGLAGGISSIYFATIAIIGIILNKFGGLDIILSLIMLGSTLGFLLYNFPPAKIYMGDTGSQFLGFIIAVIALIGYKVTTITSLVIPIVLLAIPILDTILAIIRRILKKESVGKPDKEHLHHQLLKMNFSKRSAVLVIYTINILFSLVSILFVLGDKKLSILLYVLLMIIFLFLILRTDILFKHKKK